MRKAIIKFFKNFFYNERKRTKVFLGEPFVVQYQNVSGEDVVATLFGYYDNSEDLGKKNGGNPDSVIITNLQGGDYERILASSVNSKKLKIGKWRFQSPSTNQLQQTLKINQIDANGKHYTTPMNLGILKDAYQFQDDILESKKQLSVDGNTFIEFPLKALTTFVISMFPIKEEQVIAEYLDKAWWAITKAFFVKVTDALFYRTRNHVSKLEAQINHMGNQIIWLNNDIERYKNNFEQQFGNDYAKKIAENPSIQILSQMDAAQPEAKPDAEPEPKN